MLQTSKDFADLAQRMGLVIAAYPATGNFTSIASATSYSSQNLDLRILALVADPIIRLDSVGYLQIAEEQHPYDAVYQTIPDDAHSTGVLLCRFCMAHDCWAKHSNDAAADAVTDVLPFIPKRTVTRDGDWVTFGVPFDCVGQPIPFLSLVYQKLTYETFNGDSRAILLDILMSFQILDGNGLSRWSNGVSYALFQDHFETYVEPKSTRVIPQWRSIYPAGLSVQRSLRSRAYALITSWSADDFQPDYLFWQRAIEECKKRINISLAGEDVFNLPSESEVNILPDPLDRRLMTVDTYLFQQLALLMETHLSCEDASCLMLIYIGDWLDGIGNTMFLDWDRTLHVVRGCGLSPFVLMKKREEEYRANSSDVALR